MFILSKVSLIIVFRPWHLVYVEEFENKTNALKRELFLKRQKNKEFYQRLINSMDR